VLEGGAKGPQGKAPKDGKAILCLSGDATNQVRKTNQIKTGGAYQQGARSHGARLCSGGA
jgi:hypothetical protein